MTNIPTYSHKGHAASSLKCSGVICMYLVEHHREHYVVDILIVTTDPFRSPSCSRGRHCRRCHVQQSTYSGNV